MSHADIFWAVIIIGLFLLISKMLKAVVPLFESLFLPSSIIAGFLVLLLGPQGIGLLAGFIWDSEHRLAGGFFPESIMQVWQGLPGLLISVVFAALFLGKPIPGLREMWYRAGPQVVFGQTLAWGQYVVGITLCLLVLTPVFGISPLAGALIEISFEGGHGTAAGMAGTFRELGFEEGADLALGLATVGLVSGVVIGTILVNWAARRKHIDLAADGKADVRSVGSATGTDADSMEEYEELRWEKRQEEKPTDPLSVHFGVVGLAIGIGWLIKEGLILLENNTWAAGDGPTLIAYVPLFPLAMIGGVIIQIIIDKTRQNHHISRRLMNRISGTALDFTIVSALGSLSLTAIGENMGPFILLAAAGIMWNVFGVIVLAPRLIPLGWFQRGIGDFGQSMGVTVTGLLLMRMADPQNKSGALESFGYKQLLFEPFVGGGLFTAASLPLIAQFGPGFVLGLTGGITAFWLIAGYMLFGRMIRQRNRQGAG
jgi:glutamate:Na+ symporter, ESS family